MTLEQRHSLDRVLGWLGYGLGYSAADIEQQPPSSAHHSATAHGPSNVGAMAATGTTAELRDHLCVTWQALQAITDILRSKTETARAQALDRVPRVVEQTAARVEDFQKQTSARVTSLRGIGAAWRRAWEPDRLLGRLADGVLAQLDRVRSTTVGTVDAARDALPRLSDGTGARTASLQQQTAVAVTSASERLRQLTHARQSVGQLDKQHEPPAEHEPPTPTEHSAGDVEHEPQMAASSPALDETRNAEETPIVEETPMVDGESADDQPLPSVVSRALTPYLGNGLTTSGSRWLIDAPGARSRPSEPEEVPDSVAPAMDTEPDGDPDPATRTAAPDSDHIANTVVDETPREDDVVPMSPVNSLDEILRELLSPPQFEVASGGGGESSAPPAVMDGDAVDPDDRTDSAERMEDVTNAAVAEQAIQVVSLIDEARSKSWSNVEPVPEIDAAANFVEEPTPLVVDEEPTVEIVPDTPDAEPSPTDEAASWRGRLSGRLGLGRRSSAPPSILIPREEPVYEVPVQPDPPIEEPEAPEVLDRLERLLKQDTPPDTTDES